MIVFSSFIKKIQSVDLVLVSGDDQNAYFRSSDALFSWRGGELSRPELKRLKNTAS